jgi:hypothetical protein
LEISWRNLLLGALGIVGTTALTIVATWVVNWLLQRRSQLIVEIRVNEMFNAKKLGTNLRDATRVVAVKWEEREKLPLWSHDIYNRFFNTELYLKVLITNSTLKKIAGLSLFLDVPGTDLVQIADGPLIEQPGRTALPLGDLQPKRTLPVHILATNLFGAATIQGIQNRIVMSSDEHVRTTYRFPSPDHIAFRQKMRRSATLGIIWLTFLFSASIGVIVMLARR